MARGRDAGRAAEARKKDGGWRRGEGKGGPGGGRP